MKLIVTDIRQIFVADRPSVSAADTQTRPNGTGLFYEFILQTHSFSRVPTRIQKSSVSAASGQCTYPYIVPTARKV